MRRPHWGGDGVGRRQQAAALVGVRKPFWLKVDALDGVSTNSVLAGCFSLGRIVLCTVTCGCWVLILLVAGIDLGLLRLVMEGLWDTGFGTSGGSSVAPSRSAQAAAIWRDYCASEEQGL